MVSSDPWLATDKLEHFVFCGFVSVLAYQISAHRTHSRHVPVNCDEIVAAARYIGSSLFPVSSKLPTITSSSRCSRWSRTAAFVAGSILGLGKELGDYLGWWLGRVSLRDLVADYVGIAAGIAIAETLNARKKSPHKPSFFSSTTPRSLFGAELV